MSKIELIRYMPASGLISYISKIAPRSNVVISEPENYSFWQKVILENSFDINICSSVLMVNNDSKKEIVIIDNITDFKNTQRGNYERIILCVFEYNFSIEEFEIFNIESVSLLGSFDLSRKLHVVSDKTY
ncbi:hypothetical protein [Endozoicomonas sp. ALC066]|uniref:hypothetical protein n=1 Tax=Endozoicomonas sp. ALC066 TaxID=3403078 RepID=UPI003BB498DC